MCKTFLNLYFDFQATGHNRARQRDKIAQLLEEFATVQEEADRWLGLCPLAQSSSQDRLYAEQPVPVTRRRGQQAALPVPGHLAALPRAQAHGQVIHLLAKSEIPGLSSIGSIWEATEWSNLREIIG